MESHDRLTESVEDKKFCENKTTCVLIFILLLISAIVIVWLMAKKSRGKNEKAPFYGSGHVYSLTNAPYYKK